MVRGVHFSGLKGKDIFCDVCLMEMVLLKIAFISHCKLSYSLSPTPFLFPT